MRDKVIAITGASKGIGAELARQLAAKGARLVLAARNEKELESVAAECRKLGASVIVARADVAIERDCQTIVAGAVTAFGHLDILVNNAGATMWAKFEDIRDLSILERIMQVNYMGAVYCTSHALPYLREALELDWIDGLDPMDPILVTAQGLLPYFQRDQVHGLIAENRRTAGRLRTRVRRGARGDA